MGDLAEKEAGDDEERGRHGLRGCGSCIDDGQVTSRNKKKRTKNEQKQTKAKQRNEKQQNRRPSRETERSKSRDGKQTKLMSV
jgi:hypothetical protein